MHSVCETHSFQRAADASGMSAEEVATLIDHIAVNPMAGIEIPGTGGCRKLRIAGRGKGKLSSGNVLHWRYVAGVSDHRLFEGRESQLVEDQAVSC